MESQSNQRTPDEHAMEHAARVRQILHGQHGPQATGGWGRRALFCCPYCGRIWLMDGPHFLFDLEQTTLHLISVELGADLTDLPASPCSACARTHARFRIDRDEYVTADGRLVGYGFNVEGDDPPGAHVVVLVHDAEELIRHIARHLDLRAHVPVRTDKERQTWAWLGKLTPPATADQYERDRDLADPNPPGHAEPGTMAWHWGGALWVAECPPLGRPALVHLCLALSPQERVTIAGLVTICRLIAQGVLDDAAFFA